MNIPTMTPGHVSRRRVFPETTWTPRTEIAVDLLDGTWTITLDKSDRTERYVWEFPTEADALALYHSMCDVAESYLERDRNQAN